MKAISKKILGIDTETLKVCKGLNTAKEISQQPSVWVESIKNLYDNKYDIKKFIKNINSKKNCRIILAGAGTSAFAGETCEPYLTKLLNKSRSNSYNRLSCKS